MDKEGGNFSPKNGYNKVWRVEVEAKTNIVWNQWE